MNQELIQKLTDDVIKVANKYIDEEKMSTEDVYGGLCGAAFLVVKVSKSAEAKSAVESNLEEN